MKKTAKKVQAKKKNTVVCAGCGAEKEIRGRAVLPDGWTFYDPDANGVVEPMCDKCPGDNLQTDERRLSKDAESMTRLRVSQSGRGHR